MEAIESKTTLSYCEEKIKIPNCVHVVKPLHAPVGLKKSRVEEVISAYDNIIYTASAQLKLLESIVLPTTASSSLTKTDDVTSDPVTCEDLSKHRFKYKWPKTLNYPISIVVKANLEQIPVTPWLFRRMFGAQVHIHLHKHSSFMGALPNLVNDNNRDYKLNEVKLIFSVVIHNVERMEFIVDPLRQGVLRDEHNLQRYLLRLLKICVPIDALEDAISEEFIDTVGRELLQKQKPAIIKKTLSAIENMLRSGSLLFHHSQPTAADFCLLAATYEYNLKGFPAIERWKNQLELYFNFECSEKRFL